MTPIVSLRRFAQTLTAFCAVLLVLGHVAAVLYYLWRKRRNLIAPMIRGDQALPVDAIASADGAGQRLAALLVLATAAALAWWVGSLGTP